MEGIALTQPTFPCSWPLPPPGSLPRLPSPSPGSTLVGAPRRLHLCLPHSVVPGTGLCFPISLGAPRERTGASFSLQETTRRYIEQRGRQKRVPTWTSDFVSLGLIFVCKAGMLTRSSWFPGVKARCYPACDTRAAPGSSRPPPLPYPYFAALFSSMFKVPGKRWAGCGCCEG